MTGNANLARSVLARLLNVRLSGPSGQVVPCEAWTDGVVDGVTESTCLLADVFSN